MNNNPVKMLFNLTETVANSIKLAVQKGVILASDNKIKERINICTNCENLDKQQARCNLCGCYMNTKVRFEAAKCPANKW